MKFFNYCTLLLFVQVSLFAQVKFERDFNLSPGNSYYHEWVEIDGKMYFSANDGYFGYELWQFDPATEQATRLTDLRKQGGNSNPEDIVEYEGKIYFVAHTDEHGAQLFYFDPQTWEVERISETQGDDFNPRATAVQNGKLFFTAKFDDRTNLWSYDVYTGNFSEILAPSNGHPTNFNPQKKFEYNGKLYFQARRPDNSTVLWSYDDGTGTFAHEPTQFDDNTPFWPIEGFVECSGEMMLNIGSTTERWHHYDEALDSCILLASNNSGYFRGGDCLQDKFWYVNPAVGDVNHYDPLTGQIGVLEDLLPDAPHHPFSVKVIGENLFIWGNSFSGPKSVWKYNPVGNTLQELPGTTGVETEIKTLMEQGDEYYFFAKNGVEKEVFKYDRSTENLEMIADINKATLGGLPVNIYNGFHPYNGHFYFNAHGGNNEPATLWSIDSSNGELINITEQLVSGEHPFIAYGSAVEAGGRLYFSGSTKNGQLLQLVSYQPGEDTLLWHGNIPYPSSLLYPPYLGGLVAYDGDLILSANKDFNTHRQLFRFDPGTGMPSLLPGTEEVVGDPYFIFQDKLFFRGAYTDDIWTNHYFSVDLLTNELVDIANDSTITGFSVPPFPLGDKVAYPARDPGGNDGFIQLYDPATGAKTKVLPAGFTSIRVSPPADFQGKKWFYDNQRPDTLFSLDPVTGLCEVALDMAPFGVEVSGQMMGFDSRLYFEGYTMETGQELFEYDPATGQVNLYADINPGGGHSSPEDFAVIGNRLYFTANDGWRGHELWSLANCFSVSLSALPDSLGQQAGEINLTVEGGTAPYSFSWNNWANTQNITGLASGFYEATVTDAAGCEATVFTVLDGGLAVGTDELQNMPQVRVYPNPASDVLRIELSEMKGEMSASLFNYSGVKLQEQPIRSTSENMDVSGLPGGIYFLVVRGDSGGVYAEKIVVGQ